MLIKNCDCKSTKKKRKGNHLFFFIDDFWFKLVDVSQNLSRFSIEIV